MWRNAGPKAAERGRQSIVKSSIVEMSAENEESLEMEMHTNDLWYTTLSIAVMVIHEFLPVCGQTMPEA